MDVNAEYNLGKIQERLNEIQQNILGLNTPVSKLMGEANGEVTDAKVKEFADTIISHQCNLNGCYIGISGVRKRYFELFFYLVCRAYDPQHRLHNFEDLLMIAKEMSNAYKCREELILREAGLVGNPLGFFAEIHESCMLLTERSLAHDFTEEELLKMLEEYRSKEEAVKQKAMEGERLFAYSEAEQTALWNKYKEYGVEGYTDYWQAVDNWYYHNYGAPIPEDEDYYVYTYEDEMERKKELFGGDDKSGKGIKTEFQRRLDRLSHADEYAAKAEAWKKSFENPQEYLDAYKEFSELHFYVNIISGEPKLEDSILYVLEQEGYNQIGDDEKVVSLYAELKRALRIAKRKI